MASERLERRLAAVVAADVAAYDRLMRLNDERTLADLKSARRTLILPAVTAHRGRIVKTVGDEMLRRISERRRGGAMRGRSPARHGGAQRRHSAG